MSHTALLLFGCVPLQDANANVASKVGVNLGFAMQQSRSMGMGGMMMRGGAGGKRSEQAAENERICKRFWAALILTDLIQEVGAPLVLLADVCKELGSRGAERGSYASASGRRSF